MLLWTWLMRSLTLYLVFFSEYALAKKCVILSVKSGCGIGPHLSRDHSNPFCANNTDPASIQDTGKGPKNNHLPHLYLKRQRSDINKINNNNNKNNKNDNKKY